MASTNNAPNRHQVLVTAFLLAALGLSGGCAKQADSAGTPATPSGEKAANTGKTDLPGASAATLGGAGAAVATAGKVVALSGQATATDAAGRKTTLKIGASVGENDTIETSSGSEIAIVLHHNLAVWRLRGAKSRVVSKSAAWKVAKGQGSGAALLARAEAVQTSTAGRHAGVEAAESPETAIRQQPAAPAAAPAAEPEPVKAPKKIAARTNTAASAPPSTRIVQKPVKARKPKRMQASPPPKSVGKRPSTRRSAPKKPRHDISGSGGMGFSGSGNSGLRVMGKGKSGAIVSKFGRLGDSMPKAAKATRTTRSRFLMKRVGNWPGEYAKHLWQMLRRNQRRLQRCYEIALKSVPQLAGSMQVEISITEGGRVGLVSLSRDTAGNTKMGRCVIANLRRLRVKPPSKPVNATIQLIFQPSK